jgi:hypothetical protein
MTHKKIVVQRPLKVAQDALYGHQMGLPRVVHSQTYLLHGVGDVRTCEGQVLESPCNALKLEGVLNRRPRVGSELHLEVERSHAWLTVSHGHMLDDVQRVDALVEEHPIWTTLDSNVEEVVKRPEVLHHEFLL